MRTSVNLSIDADTFYQFLISNLKADIRACTGQDVEPQVGYEYVKRLNRMVTKSGVSTKCLVSDLVENTAYELKIISNVETTIIRYEIENLKTAIKVTYIEDTVSDSNRITLSYKIFRFAHSAFIGKRKIGKKLRQIESYLQTTTT